MIYTLDFRRRFLGRFLPPGAGQFSWDDPGDMGDPYHTIRKVSLMEMQARLDGRRVCMLICGYNSSADGARASYERIMQGMQAMGVKHEDYIFVQWPTSTGPGYWAAESKVYWDGFIPGIKWWEGMGNRLRDVLKQLPCASVDVVAHSLGNGVILDALRAGDVAGIRHLFLTNPAVTDDALSYGGGQFLRSVQSISGQAVVFYSRRDGVLAKAFSAARLWMGAALGYIGPKGETPANVVAVDATAWCDGHSGCRDAAEYYWHIAERCERSQHL